MENIQEIIKDEIEKFDENVFKDDDPTSRAFRDSIKASDPEGYDKRWKKERPGEEETPRERPKVMNRYKKDLN